MHYPCRMIVLDEPLPGSTRTRGSSFGEGRGLRRAAQLGGDPGPSRRRACCFFLRSCILDHGGDPDVVRVMANLLMEISAKFANLNRKNHLLTEPRLRNRLLICFNGLTPAPNGIRIMPFGQKELAQYLNVNRSALNRELSRMKEEGVIEMDGRAVRILKAGE